MMYNFFERLYDKKIDAIGLAFFRITYFIVLFLELIQMYYFRELYFHPIPFIAPYELIFDWAFYAWFICCFCLIIGWQTRLMVVVNYILTLVFISTIREFEYHVHYTYTTVNFFFLFLPIARRLSVDRLLLSLKHSNTRFTYNPPSKTTVLSYTMPLLVALAFVYTDSIFYKVTSDFWMKGLGVWFPSTFPQATITSADSLGGFLINNVYITKFFGWLTVIFEFVFIFLFWFKRFRPILLLVGVGLHLGILITFPIPWFALAVAVAYFLLVSLHWYGKLGKWLTNNKKKLTFYYDEECPLCARAKITIHHFDFFKNIQFKGVQNNQSDAAIKEIDLDLLLDNIHAVDDKGTVSIGLNAYIKVFMAMRYTIPLALLLKIPGIYHLAQKIYVYVASNREVERCTEDNCGYTPPLVPQNPDELKLLKNLKVKRIRVWGIALGLTFITLLQMGISYRSGAAYSVFHRIGFAETALGKSMTKLSQKIEKNAKLLFGLTHHAVFMDYHFKNYVHIISVSHLDKEGAEN